MDKKDKEVMTFVDKAKTKLEHANMLYEVQSYADCVALSSYSMYLCAKALLIKKDVNIPKSHQAIIKRFSLEYVHKEDFEYIIYKYLASTQTLREEADYSAFDSIDSKLAKQKIRQACSFNLSTLTLTASHNTGAICHSSSNLGLFQFKSCDGLISANCK